MKSLPAPLLPLAGAVWLAVLFTAPAALGRGLVPAATVGVYQSSSLLCHQRAERSFRIAGMQMPVCARCLGLYASAAVGAVAALMLTRKRNSPTASAARVALAIGAVPILLSVGLEWVGLIEGTNVGRFLSALPLGGAAGWFVQRVATAAEPRHALSFR